MIRLTLLAAAFVASCMAQTPTATYSIPSTATVAAGQTPVEDVCVSSSINANVVGCYLHDIFLVPNADGSASASWATPFMWCNWGGYWAQCDQQTVMGQNPAAKAQFFLPPGAPVVTSMPVVDGPYAGDTMYVITGVGNPDGTSPDPNVTLDAVILTHFTTRVVQCGRWRCTQYVHTVDEGTVTLSEVPAGMAVAERLRARVVSVSRRPAKLNENRLPSPAVK